MANTIAELCIRPTVCKEVIHRLCSDIFGLSQITILRELESYDDRNFHLSGIRNKAADHEEFVFKVMNSKYSYQHALADGRLQFMQQLALGCKTLHFPEPVKSQTGEFNVLTPLKVPVGVKQSLNPGVAGQKDSLFVIDEDGDICFLHIVRTVTYLKGEQLNHVELDGSMLYDVGKMAGEIQKCGKNIDIPELDDHEPAWDLSYLSSLRHPHLSTLKDQQKHAIASTVIDTFEKCVFPQLENLPKRCIHGDLNEGNILLMKFGSEDKARPRGIIDFGDCSYSPRVFDLAILIAYMLLEADLQDVGMTNMEVSCIILKGFFDGDGALTDGELNLLYDLVTCRIVQSLLNGNYQATCTDPENAYLLNTSRNGWKVLSLLLQSTKEAFTSEWEMVKTCKHS